MKPTISIQQFLEEAAKHESIASHYRTIAGALKGLNPNVELMFSENKPMANRSVAHHAPSKDVIPSQTASTKMEALVQVLKESGKPMDKFQIEKAMKLAGHEITPETLTSYLSRNKGGVFLNPRRGLWKLSGQIPVPERADLA